MRERHVIAGLLVSVLAESVLAHETWMMPSTFFAKLGEETRLDMSSGMSFPRLESPILAERVAQAAYRLGQDVVDVTGLKTAKRSLVLRQSFTKEGVATIWMDLKPKERLGLSQAAPGQGVLRLMGMIVVQWALPPSVSAQFLPQYMPLSQNTPFWFQEV